ncbi:Glutamate--tRNA ligase mitochondrial [Agyrium rufum]|nr:Glutamate--tRNA ligase mitochondrial [Agyrium rufum]
MQCSRAKPSGKALGNVLQRSHVSTRYLKPNQQLPTSPARTRFAPSPTGSLHLGSLRTALYNYLLAKATGGRFILRIEDTDKKRTIPGANERLIEDLHWAKVEWDEGPDIGGLYGPYTQSSRTELYIEHANKLLADRKAYRCFCSSERLNALAERRSKLRLPTDYDRTCAGIPSDEAIHRAQNGEAHVIRLKSPDEYPTVHDLVYGPLGKSQKKAAIFKRGEIAYEDPVLIKSDGMATYHLANVVDDHLMRITHVIRGVEWQPSTAKHLVLYDAFGWRPPAFGHVGLLMNGEGQKLSKRNAGMGTDVASFRDRGIFPEALVNFSALLGWSHALTSDILPMNQLIDNFTLKFTKGNTIVQLGKLDYLQKQYGQRFIDENSTGLLKMATAVSSEVRKILREPATHDADDGHIDQYQDWTALCTAILKADSRQYLSAQSFAQRSIYFFRRPDVSRIRQDLTSTQTTLLSASRSLAAVSKEAWNTEALQAALHHIADQAEQKGGLWAGQSEAAYKDLLKVLRLALFGGSPGPSMAEALAILGSETAIARITEYSNSGTSKNTDA